ncbi:MAG: ACP S-malonyltransferase [Calditrichaeota bacterium]|nr:ACP S-malonyltransferase [Calditrichota bacterium]
MTGFVFPGQGSQQVGMGADVYASHKLAKEYYDYACTVLDFDLKTVSFEGPEDRLKQTYITQPALFVHSVVMDALLKEKGVRPGLVAGHSLGEYSAVVSAGALTFEQALSLVKLRGELMQHAGEKQPGTMAAIIGLSEENVRELCKTASSAGVVVPANFNSPGQIVISGSVEGVHRAVELAREQGAKRAVELVVSGAFHSPLMESAAGELEKALKAADFHKPEIPLVSNVTARATTDPEEIRSNLLQQLTHPVRWVESVKEMIARGVTQFFEVGSGRVLTGLSKRIDRRVPCVPVGTVQDLEKISI